jgi:hypothetical protein
MISNPTVKKFIKTFTIGAGHVRSFVLPNIDKEKNMPQPIFKWGANNNFPDELDKKIEMSDNIESGLQSLTELAFGLGIQVYKNELVDGKIVKTPVIKGPAVDFIRNNNVAEEYLEKAFYNFFRYGNAFASLRRDMRGQVNGLFVYDAPWCRLEKVNQSSLLVENVYVSDQWNTVELRSLTEFSKYKKYVSKIANINRYNWESFFKNNKDQFVCWHIADYTPGTRYYGEAPWYPLLRNGIIETDKQTGERFKAYYNKSMSIMYHIEVLDAYIKHKCKGDESIDNQEKVIQDIQQKMDGYLVGSENSYSSIVTTMFRDASGEQQSAIKINVLKNPMDNNSTIKDTQLIASRINNALRIDDAIINSKISGSKEADSGSEKKNALNSHNTRMALIREKILFPLYMIKKINGWDADIEFGIKVTELESLDKNSTGQKTKLQ